MKGADALHSQARSTRWAWLWCGLVMCAAPAAAQGPSTLPELHRARLALSHYDVEGGETLEVIDDLGALLATEPPAHARDEAAFLRSVAAADLLLIAQLEGRDAIRQKLGALFDVAPEQLVAHLEQRLGAISDPLYADPVRDALDALRLIDAAAQGDAAAFAQASGVRRDLLWLSALRRAAEQDEGRLEALAAFGSDPCAEKPQECEPLYSSFAPTSRRALAALAQAGAAERRLTRAAKENEPLSRALAGRIAADYAALRALELAPIPLLDAKLGIAAAAQGGTGQAPDMIVIVREGEVAYAFVPRVRLDEAGAPALRAPGEPHYPTLGRIRMPAASDFRPYIRHIDEVVDVMHPLLADRTKPLRIAVGATEVPSHVVARVLLSLRRSGEHTPLLLARGGAGEARALPLNVLYSAEAEKMPKPAVSVRIRLGGYSLYLPGGKLDIPRVRGDEGWRFDPSALAARIPSRMAASPAALTFMSDVASETLTDTAFRIAPSSDALQLVIP